MGVVDFDTGTKTPKINLSYSACGTNIKICQWCRTNGYVFIIWYFLNIKSQPDEKKYMAGDEKQRVTLHYLIYLMPRLLTCKCTWCVDRRVWASSAQPWVILVQWSCPSTPTQERRRHPVGRCNNIEDPPWYSNNWRWWTALSQQSTSTTSTSRPRTLRTLRSVARIERNRELAAFLTVASETFSNGSSSQYSTCSAHPVVGSSPTSVQRSVWYYEPLPLCRCYDVGAPL